ncbi:MAG: hypothetical protein JKY01_11455 [Pseudomonadales bacterium]|nr:hypothetical protein [Pseudomonadales bacterium]
MKNNTVPSTLVLQSHRTPLPYSWLSPCLDSVENWAKHNCFDYQFLGDEFFEIVPDWVIKKTKQQLVIATDIARLKWLQKYLASGYERVVWLDADFLIFAPERFTLLAGESLPEKYALGREVWVQAECSNNPPRKFKAYKKVHNAFLLFEQGNCFLDFYAAHAERLLEKNQGTMPPQFIGPKLLTALHNIVQCPVQEDAAMLSPWVIQDVLKGGGAALTLFLDKSPQQPAGANLCSSLVGELQLKENDISDLVELLLAEKGLVVTT